MSSPRFKKAPVIALCGRARSGKDTAAEFIHAARGGYRYAFADPLRAMLRAIGIDMSHPEWIAAKEDPIPSLGKSPRFMLQTLGTEWGRETINQDIWVIMAAMHLKHSGPGMILSDLRFENEADWVRSMGGIVVHIRRHDAPSIEAHKSEGGVAVHEDDIVIDNDGTLEDLQRQIIKLVDEA